MSDASPNALESLPILGVPDIDRQHRRIVAILGALVQAVGEADESADHAARLYDEFVEYVRFHFRTEERLMAKHAYADELAHAVAHHMLMDEVCRLRTRFLAGETLPVLAALTHWVLHHVAESDRVLAEFLLGRLEPAAGAP